MFYNHDFMTSKKAGFRIVWLASTLGHASRRLTKRDFITVDVIKTCQSVAHPVQPLALRTSSHLLYGVARVYTKQAEYWMTDVTNHYENICKLMSSGSGPRRQLGGLVILGNDTTTIDMPGRSRANAVNIPFRSDWFATHPTIDMQWSTNSEVGDGNIHLGSLSSLRRGSQASSYGQISGANGVSSSLSNASRDRYTLDPSEIRKARSTPSLAGDYEILLDLGLHQDGIDGEGIDLGLENGNNDNTVVLDNNGFNLQMDWQHADGFGLPGGDEGLPIPSSKRVRSRSPSSDAQNQLPRAKKIRFALSDSSTELSNETVLFWRENIAVKMTETQITIFDKDINKKARQQVDYLVYGAAAANPLLSTMWEDSVAATRSMMDSRGHEVEIEDPGVALMPLNAQEQGLLQWQDDTALPLWDEDPGVARGAYPTSSPGPATERGRGSQSSEKRNITTMPWDQPLAQIETIIEEDVTNQTISRSFSVETPTGLRRQSKRQSSITAASIGQADDEDGGQIYDNQHRQSLTESQSIAKSEDANFLSYIGQIRAELPIEQPLFFSDLAPIADSTPHIAARAFYNTLVLATSKLLRVDQQKAYGDIEIAMVID